MKKLLISLCAVASLSACCSVKPDYVVRETMKGGEPDWVEDVADAAKNKEELKEFRFYKAEAESTKQRLCLKSAEARATQNIASEVAQEIFAKFQEKNESFDDAANSKMQDVLEQNIKTNLHGVQLAGTYWERRAYLTEMGAAQNIEKFKCDAVVKIKVSALEEALDAYKKRTLRQLKDKDVKKALQEAVDAYEDSLSD